MDIVLELCREITAMCGPERIIQFGSKLDAGGGMRDVSLCVIVETDDKDAVERLIYLSTDCDISFNLLLYTPGEWRMLTDDPQSYASRIVQKGTSVYVRPSA